jgi:hypothetical protein
MLWTDRLALIKMAPETSAFQDELEAFGFWFSSTVFEEKWAVEQLAEVLKLGGGRTLLRPSLRRLADVSETSLHHALTCLKSIAEKDEYRQNVPYFKQEFMDLLKRCLQSSIQEVANEAEDFVHWLGARGYREFRGLLQD